MAQQNILFDFGNVLIDIDIPRAFKEIEALLRSDVEEEAEVEIHRLIPIYETGAINSEVFINGILKFCRPEVQATDVIAAWKSMLIGIPQARIEWLDKMKGFHRMALLSNTNEIHLEGVYSHLKKDHAGIDFEDDYFEQVFYSHLIGLRKPDPRCFEFVLNELEWEPEDTVFIDDVEENVAAADKLGMTGIHLLVDMPVEELIPPGSLVKGKKPLKD